MTCVILCLSFSRSIPRSISMSMMTSSPKCITINAFAIVNGNPVILPVEIVFTFEVQNLSCPTRSQYYIMVALSIRIRTTLASIIVNPCIACLISIISISMQPKVFIGAIGIYCHRPSTSQRSVAVEYNGQLIAY